MGSMNPPNTSAELEAAKNAALGNCTAENPAFGRNSPDIPVTVQSLESESDVNAANIAAGAFGAQSVDGDKGTDITPESSSTTDLTEEDGDGAQCGNTATTFFSRKGLVIAEFGHDVVAGLEAATGMSVTNPPVLNDDSRFEDMTNPTGTGFPHITDGSKDEAAKLVENDDVHASAGIVESKLSLNYATHSNANDPTSDEKSALAGTSGTAVSGTNKLVDNADSRLSDDRAPTSHSHAAGDITSGTIDGDLLAAPSDTKRGSVPSRESTGTKVLYDDDTFKDLPSSGEANTSSNVDNGGGTAGVGLAESKDGVNLPFKSLDGSQFEANGSHEVRIKSSVLGGSSSVLSDAQADRPDVGTEGRLFIPTDDYPMSYDNGTRWVPILGNFLCSAVPAVEDFTAVAANAQITLTSCGDGLKFLQNSLGSASNRSFAFVKALPTAPYKIEIGFKIRNWYTTNYQGMGLVLTDGTSTPKLFHHMFQARATGGITAACQFNELYCTSPTAWGEDNLVSPGINYILATTTLFFRIIDDNTNLYFDVSIDGVFWRNVATKVRTNYFIATHGGLGCFQSTTLPVAGTKLSEYDIFHWVFQSI